MNLQELKEIIETKFGWDEFQNLIQETNYDWDNKTQNFKEEYVKNFKEATGLDINYHSEERSSEDDHDSYYWRWTINNQYYQAVGYYSSHEGTNIENISEFIEVVPQEKTIVIFVEKK